MRQIIILFLVCLLALPMVTFAQNKLVTSNVLHRVFLIKYGDIFCSSFTVDVDNRQYLVTAKHILDNLKESEKIEIYHDSQWKKVEVKRIDLQNPKIDILVLVPTIQLSPPLELQSSTDNIVLSQDVFFLGFPFGMNTEAKALNNFFPLPFVKKGIISAMALNNKEEKILYVDGQANPGFSGGPIVFFDLYKKKIKVAAVVSGYRKELAEIYDKNEEIALKAVTNSGIIRSYVIEHAIDAIKKNPIGVEIKSK